MQPSPLELLFYYVESLRWKVEAGFDPGKPAPLQCDDLEWHLQHDNESADGNAQNAAKENVGNTAPRKEISRETAYRLRLSLPPREGRFAYSFEIVVVGYFRLGEEVPDESIVRVLDANAPALLYGVAREALATSVGRGPFRPLILPTVHFQGLQRDQSDTSEKTSSETLDQTPLKAAKKPRKVATPKITARKISESTSKRTKS